ncbi:MAG TPA: tartrate-resistant acid phosphatase type 5 family protein [Caulobacteraceae bacterium]|nr:tartrate-resistant acid phosphatase type 5 family protein [Caulobacteraceae bacterium]
MTQTFSRRRALQLMGVAAVLPFSRAWAADGDALTFLAVGDWGRDGADRQSEVAEQMGLTARAVRARFVISVGDNFYEKGVESATDPKWKTSFEDVYAAPSLQVPWYVALGNHDYYGTPEAQLDYAKTSPRWRMPRRYYSRRETAPDGSSLELFVLDTTPLIPDYLAHKGLAPKLAGLDPDGQVAWFAAALAASTADWKVVVGHHPIWAGDNSESGKEGHWGSPDLVAKLDPLLKRHGVHLYLNGHDHELQHTVRGANHYVCTGAGSQMEPFCDTVGADFCSLQSGFIACSVSRQTLRVAYRDWQGNELRVVDIPA